MKWFPTVNGGRNVTKDYNGVVPIRKATFKHLYITIVRQFVKGVYDISTAAMEITVLPENYLNISFWKIALKLIQWPGIFSSNFEKSFKFSSRICRVIYEKAVGTQDKKCSTC